MSTKHSKAAARFIENRKQEAWHDETLWMDRAKRDKMSHSLPEWERLRELACDIKLYSNSHLDTLLEEFEKNATANGIHVHWAKNAEEHNRIVYEIIQKHGGKNLVKSKSMLSEECGLSPYLEARGIDAVESDLGERIMQFMGTPPSHIVLPAIHVKREEVGKVFEKELHTEPGNSDPTYLTHAARAALREKFLHADIAMTGVNFAVASSGAKLSEGCRHCYVYRGDSQRGRDSSIITKTGKFDFPIQRKRNNTYKIPPGNLVYTCFTSDFLIEEADEWREEAWQMMRERQDLHFLFITKRIDRLKECLPSDWGEGYENVTICCTMENQDRVDYRLPIYKAAPIKHKIIICEPLLTEIDFRGELGPWVEQIVVGGESGKEARICNYEWVLDIRRQSVENKINFWFKQTGYRLLKEGHEYFIARRFQHSQARKAGINYTKD